VRINANETPKLENFMNNKTALIALSTLLATSLTLPAVYAHQHGGDGHSMDKEERMEMRQEMREKRKQHRKDRLLELDANGDDRVDLDEYLANAERRFNELDGDGDGFVTTDEARAHHKKMREKHKEMRKAMHSKMKQEGDAE
jgi:hypothetical protein